MQEEVCPFCVCVLCLALPLPCLALLLPPLHGSPDGSLRCGGHPETIILPAVCAFVHPSCGFSRLYGS